MSVVFINGRFTSPEHASISIQNRAVQFGDGVFTTIRVDAGKIEYFDRHVKRLFNHCAAMRIEPPEFREEWAYELIHKANAASGVWRMKITITAGQDVALDVRPRPAGNLIITISPYIQPVSASVRLSLYPDPIEKPTAAIKSLAYVDRLWIKDYALKQLTDDAITTSSSGNILETAFSNLFWVDGNNFFTPDPTLPLINGISVSVMAEAAAQMGMNINFVRSKVEDIPNTAHIYISNSLIRFLAVTEIAGRKFDRDFILEEKLHFQRAFLYTPQSQ